jgi:hypothetical protein
MRALPWAVVLGLLACPLNPATIVVDDVCTLADAITAANEDAPVGGCAAGDGADEILLTASVALDSALPQVGGGSVVTLRGNGFAVRRLPTAPDFRIFEVAVDGALTIDNAWIVGGVAERGAGIRNLGDLTVVNSTITGNDAWSIGGGGIENSRGTLTLTGSTLSANSALAGGGLYTVFGTAFVTDSHLDGNFAEVQGGGVKQYGGTLRVSGSTISGNRVSGGDGAPGHYAGGGLFTSPGSEASLTNTTVSGNSIGAGNGGGVFLYYGELSLTNTTVAENHAPRGGAIYQYIAYTTLTRSVVSGSCTSRYPFINGGDTFGCGFAELTGLSPVLADNGGPTPTHALLEGSSAIDAAGTSCGEFDQRGFGRNGDCDSGAYEFRGVRPAIAGTAFGLDVLGVVCGNLTTGGRITLDLDGVSDWDCEAAGFEASLADSLQQIVVGEAVAAETPIFGSVGGMQVVAAQCVNLSTGQRVRIRSAGLTSEWHCSRAGLEQMAGDRLRIVVRGESD